MFNQTFRDFHGKMQYVIFKLVEWTKNTKKQHTRVHDDRMTLFKKCTTTTTTTTLLTVTCNRVCLLSLIPLFMIILLCNVTPNNEFT